MGCASRLLQGPGRHEMANIRKVRVVPRGLTVCERPAESPQVGDTAQPRLPRPHHVRISPLMQSWRWQRG